MYMSLFGVKAQVNRYGRGLRVFCLLTNRSMTMSAGFTFGKSGTEAVVDFSTVNYTNVE